MLFDLDLVPVSPDAPRILWRNTVIEEQPTSDYDVFIDPMTWNLDTVPATIDLDLSPRPIACNAIGIARADWSGQVVSVYYDDGSGWTLAGAWQPRAGVPFLGLFTFQTAPEWRITVTGPTLTASVIKLGMALAMQRNTYGGNEPITKRVNTSPKSQLGAHFVGRQIHQTRREQSFKFSKLTPEWVRAYFKPFAREAKTESAFVAWRPATYPQDVIYGFCDDDIKPTNEMANGMMKVDFNIEGGEL
jgi:hypothetical protein